MIEYLASSDSSYITDRIRTFFRSCQTGTFGSAATALEILDLRCLNTKDTSFNSTGRLTLVPGFVELLVSSMELGNPDDSFSWFQETNKRGSRVLDTNSCGLKSISF